MDRPALPARDDSSATKAAPVLACFRLTPTTSVIDGRATRPCFCMTARDRPSTLFPASRGAGSAHERRPELAGQADNRGDIVTSLQARAWRSGYGTRRYMGRRLRSLGELFGALGREVEILVER